MKPIKFKGYNTIIAKDQPEYMPLPAFKNPDDLKGQVISCWKGNFLDRIIFLFTGKVWLSLLSFNKSFMTSGGSIRKIIEFKK